LLPNTYDFSFLFIRENNFSWAWRYMSIIPALGRLKQEDQEFEAKARHWWLTPVILPTSADEIRWITICGQPRQIVCEISSPI
jgi:hypothetical protein